MHIHPHDIHTWTMTRHTCNPHGDTNLTPPPDYEATVVSILFFFATFFLLGPDADSIGIVLARQALAPLLKRAAV